MNSAISAIRQVSKLVVFLSILLLVAVASHPALATDPFLGGLDKTMGTPNAQNLQALTVNDNQPLDVRVGLLIGQILSYVGVIFFILIVYGGLMWMTAQGNDQKVAKAKELIINATIGLIIVMSAYAITSFIGNTALSS